MKRLRRGGIVCSFPFLAPPTQQQPQAREPHLSRDIYSSKYSKRQRSQRSNTPSLLSREFCSAIFSPRVLEAPGLREKTDKTSFCFAKLGYYPIGETAARERNHRHKQWKTGPRAGNKIYKRFLVFRENVRARTHSRARTHTYTHTNSGGQWQQWTALRQRRRRRL